MRVQDVPPANVVNLKSADVPEGAPYGTWPCASCEQPYDIEDGWVVTVSHGCETLGLTCRMNVP